MSKVMTRSEVPNEHRWSTEDLYTTLDQWNDEFKQVKQYLEQVSKYKGELHDPKQLKACFQLEDQLSMLIERLYVYAHLKHHEDMTDAKYQALADKAKKLSVEVSEALSFVTPEILSLSEETLEQFIQLEELAAYKMTLEEILRHKAHVLSKTEEALLAQAGNIAQAPSTIFGMINNADMKFPAITDEHGVEKELTHGNYIQFLESPNRDVRKQAFEAMYETYAKQKNTLASTLSANLNKNIFYAKARKHASALEKSLFADHIPKEVYTNLIDTVHEHLPQLHRYLDLRRKLLDVDQLHMYDLFAPIVDEVTMEINYEEAKKTVKESLTPLGENYGKILQQGYDNGWIDVYENSGKRSGAYSWGAYGTHPYVLLNHKDNLNSMFTLAHEMGHAIHSYLSDEEQPYREAQYTIFLAEVASTLNEALLMDHMLQLTTDPKEKLYLLSYYADQFRTTVFRQTMFAEFEKIIHEKAEAGESFTPQTFSEIYYELNKQYHGKQMAVDQPIEMEWARIPHFYSSFYVYKYATGFAAATSFAKQIADEGQPAVDRYLGFLKSGSSDFSIEILKQAGVDMSTPEPIRQAMSVFESIIDEMESIVAELEQQS